MGSLAELQKVLRQKDDRIKDLERRLIEKDEKIQELVSQLDKYKSIFHVPSSPDVGERAEEGESAGHLGRATESPQPARLSG